MRDLVRPLAAGFALIAAAPPPEPLPPRNRAEATAIIGELRRIVSPEGAQAIETVPIGGIDQVVSIRSQDVRNPVLIYLHGGPGFVETPLDWWWGRGWDEFFTVVHWDQRNSGRTYVESGPAAPDTLTPERFQADTEELVQWALRRFGKRKLFVLGHSWGSILGLRLAAEHPEWLHAYIGMGQLTNARESERRGWLWTMARARADGNVEAVRALEAIEPYGVEGQPLPMSAILTQRRWLNHYGGAVWNRAGAGFETAAIPLAPEYRDEDVRRAFDGQAALTDALFPHIVATDLSTIRRLEVPLFLFLGRHDINVSSEVAAEWFAGVEAPTKQLTWFERSGHHPNSEEPGKLLTTLVSSVRPIAVAAGDVAPDPR